MSYAAMMKRAKASIAMAETFAEEIKALSCNEDIERTKRAMRVCVNNALVLSEAVIIMTTKPMAFDEAYSVLTQARTLNAQIGGAEK
jgi:hypothetical protein